MTKQDFIKLGPDGFKKLPWDYPALVWCPGRYYVGMWYVELPKVIHPPLGGNTTFMLWRFDNEPELWTLIFRFRWYESKDVNDPDRKSWYLARFSGDEKTVTEKATQSVKLVAGLALATTGNSSPWEFFEVRGDSNKIFELLKTGAPHWLNISQKLKVNR